MGKGQRDYHPSRLGKGIDHAISDSGLEFVANEPQVAGCDCAKTLYIEPGSSWENDYCESFNSKLQDEFMNGEISYSLKELRVLVERRRVHTTPSDHIHL